MARSSKAKKGKKGNSISVDLSEVESKTIVPDGDYLLTVKEVTQEEGQDSGEAYLKWVLQIEGGGVVYENTSLSEAALWRLRGMLESLGMEIPDDKFDLDLEDLVGEECGGTIVSEVYNQKKKNIVVETFPASQIGEDDEEDDEEEEDEEPKSKKKGKSKSKPEPEEEDEDEEEEDEEEEPKPKKSKKGKAKKGKIKKGSEVTFEDDGDDYQGTVVKVAKDGSCEVDVDDEIWELDIEDLVLA